MDDLGLLLALNLAKAFLILGLDVYIYKMTRFGKTLAITFYISKTCVKILPKFIWLYVLIDGSSCLRVIALIIATDRNVNRGRILWNSNTNKEEGVPVYLLFIRFPPPPTFDIFIFYN